MAAGIPERAFLNSSAMICDEDDPNALIQKGERCWSRSRGDEWRNLRETRRRGSDLSAL